MRAIIPALGAALAAAAALAQQATDQPALQPNEQVETVPQPRFEAEPAGEVVPQPRFVRAPGSDGFEVMPLAPPGAAPGDPAGGAAIIDAQPGAGGAGGAEDGTGQHARRFKAVPDDGSTLIRPSGPAVPIDSPDTELRHGVRLRELDKMTGQTETFELAVGDERQVDRLKIRLEACRSPEGNDTHGTIAFLKVWDTRYPEEEAFSGWMFAESPSLSALDHPRYDLWVISCTTSAVAVSSPSE